MDQYKGDLYASYRPTYPAELIKYVASLCEKKEVAWDCCTGTGSVASLLADEFKHVIASDISTSQLEYATKKLNIEFRLEDVHAAHVGLHTVDLVTVAQAFHWLDATRFMDKVVAVTKDNGILAVWNYSFCLDEKIEVLTQKYLASIATDNEKKLLATLYQGYQIEHEKFQAIQFDKQFFAKKLWSMEDYFAYLQSISLAQKYFSKNKSFAFETISADVLAIWGDTAKKMPVIWPLHLQIFEKKNV